MYRPEGATGALPGVLVLYGGGWTRGSTEAVREQSRRLAARGFVAVASEYRLSGESRWPAHIHDVKAALRWTHANANDLGIDASKIAAVGFSAGAHLALLVAGTAGHAAFAGDGGNPGASESVAAVAAFYPPVHFHMPGEKRSGASPATALAEDLTSAEAEEAAPMRYVGPDYPPTMLLHGTGDKVVPVSASLRLHEALMAARVPVDLRVYHDLPHGFPRLPGMMEVAMTDVASFLDRVMVSPERYVIEGTMPGTGT
ncbi:MAG: alpha/beta hydrolase [Chloroflexi bacterium]|nr:alpha/beta hydrolase [Chloroflexota bacterium]